MKNTKVTLVPLTEDDREKFILDHEMSDDEHDPDEGPDEMFRFIKMMK